MPLVQDLDDRTLYIVTHHRMCLYHTHKSTISYMKSQERIPKGFGVAELMAAFKSLNFTDAYFPRKLQKSSRSSHQSYAFVTFDTAANAARVLDIIEKSRQVLPLGAQKKGETSLFLSLKAMTKQTWGQRMIEYSNRIVSKQKELDQVRAMGSTQTGGGLVYIPGTVCAFTNAYQKTSSKTLKRLFEMCSPVAFVDYVHGSGQGAVRFKDRLGAQRAKVLFASVAIHQPMSEDSGSLLVARSLGKKGSDDSEGMKTNDKESGIQEQGISLRILRGQEEAEYWERAYARSHSASQKKRHLREDEENQEDTVEQTGKVNTKTAGKRGVHTTFDDGDEEEE